jgi:glycosyltransferase involved in cell wall biosynthesis
MTDAVEKLGREHTGNEAKSKNTAATRTIKEMIKERELRGQAEDTQCEPYASQKKRHTDVTLVTVIIPCYNMAHFVGEAIESVLAQSYPHFAIIVVDDGSTDNAAEVARRYPGVHYIWQNNQGASVARNSGLRHSEGKYVVFLDADDRLLPEALEVGVKQLNAHPECAFTSGHRRLIAADGSLRSYTNPPCVEADHYLAMLRRLYIWPPAVAMFRRSVFDSVGGFDESLRAAEDYDLYLRIAREFPVHSHNELVADRRKHDTNATGNYARLLKFSLTVLRRQRKHVKGNKQSEEAHHAGIRREQQQWGDPLVHRMQAHMREGEWKQAIRDAWALLRYHPQGLSLLINMRHRRLAQQLRTRDEQLRKLKVALEKERQKKQQLGENNRRLREKNCQLGEKNRQLALRRRNLQQQLRDIRGSRTRKLLRTLAYMRVKLRWK